MSNVVLHNGHSREIEGMDESTIRYDLETPSTATYESPSTTCRKRGSLPHCAYDHYREDGPDRMIRCCWCGRTWVLAKQEGLPPHYSKPHGEWA